MGDHGQLRRAPWPLVLAIGLIGLVSFAAVLPALLGSPVLPSEAWVGQARAAARTLGAVEALGLGWLAARWLKRRGRGKPVRALGGALAVLAGFSLGSSLVYLGPVLPGVINGAAVAHVFTVAEVPRRGRPGCKSSVTLSGLPVLSDQICNLPEALRATLMPGQLIEAWGRGNRFGLLPMELGVLD